MSMTRNRLTACFIPVIFLLSANTANAALYLLFNVGDNEDREVHSAADNLQAARSGNKPAVIDSGAKQYYVHLPGATMDTLSGAAVRVGQPAPAQAATTSMSMSASESASDAGTGTTNDDSGDTGWIEYRAPAATLMLFSPDGADEESDIRFEPARVYLRRFDDDEIYAMITGENGNPPAPDAGD